MKILLSRRVKNNRSFEEIQSAGIDTATESELWDILHSESDKGIVAYAENVTDDMLEILADDSDSFIRTCVADSEHTPVYLLEQLIHDPVSDVKYHAIRNPNQPLSVLKELCQDPDRNTQWHASVAIGRYYADHPEELQKELEKAKSV